MKQFVLPHGVEHIKERKRRKTFSLSIIITVTEQRGCRAKRDQRKVEWWPLAVETHPDEKVKDKLSHSSLLLIILLLHLLLTQNPTWAFDARTKLYVLILPVPVALTKDTCSRSFSLLSQTTIRWFTTPTVLCYLILTLQSLWYSLVILSPTLSSLKKNTHCHMWFNFAKYHQTLVYSLMFNFSADVHHNWPMSRLLRERLCVVPIS